MERTFQSFRELLDFDFSGLEPQKSNYLKLIPSDGALPEVSKCYLKKMRLTEKNLKESSQIIMEITPKWLVMMIYDKNERYVRRDEYPLKQPRIGYDSNFIRTLLLEIFQT